VSTNPADRTDTGFVNPDGTWQALCGICAKKVDPGRRCCPGIGDCFQKLHQRDRDKQWADLITLLCYRFGLTREVVAEILMAGRKF
jgi:hypothetical protein